MSLERIKNVFEAMIDTNNCSWTLTLINYRQTKDKTMNYSAREIHLVPNDALTNFVSDLAKVYIGKDNSKFSKYASVRNYDGSEVGNYIYKVDVSFLQKQEDFDSFISAVDNPDEEMKLSKTKFNAYVIAGVINTNDSNEQSIKLITVRTPLSVLRNKFWYSEGKFQRSDEQTLSLSLFVNAMIIDNDIYFFDLNAESLFGLERTYREICTTVSNEIVELDLVTDSEQFQQFVQKGHNPRRFLSYKHENIVYIQNADNLLRISNTFKIKLSENKVDTSDEKNVENFVKFICGKAMIDPVDGSPREVPSSYAWT